MNQATRRFRTAVLNHKFEAAERAWATGEVDLEARAEGSTVLHSAVRNRRKVEYLVGKGADLEAPLVEDYGNGTYSPQHLATPLMLAIDGWSTIAKTVTRELLAAGEVERTLERRSLRETARTPRSTLGQPSKCPPNL